MARQPKYTLLGEPTAQTVAEANEMFDELYSLVNEVAAHDILSSLHSDTRVDPEQTELVRGDILVAQITPQGNDVIRFQRFAIGEAATVLKTTDGIDLTYAKVVLTAGAAQEVTGTLPILNGGTGNTAYTAGSVLFAGPGTPPTQLIEDAANLVFDDSANQLLVSGSVRTPLVVGGTGVTDDLTLQATSGVGTTGSFIVFKVGNNGAVTTMEMDHLGNVGIGIGAAFPATGTFGLVFGDGTALTSMASNTAGFYANDVGGTVELFAINEANEVSQLTGTGKTYTPTRSAEANLDANATMFEAQYARVQNTVTVSGRFTADPTTPATPTSFEMSLPIASNIGAVEDLAGVAFCGAIAGQGAQIEGSVANNTAVVSWVAGDVTSQSWSFVFQYQVI